ncbi:hypothetical protein DV515_00008622 [Chloebia gouldiae]|uniref:CRAL-TRIO domain-containing protein n=1 Tax=Chloebia gouldiae TaxID=44316 RepID=A0A3L8SEE5_CHLGU|nr:hypothetical protein DV515_00008622 [Chloebia gouldiae]
MQQEIRPLVAVDIIEQLHRQFAILSAEFWPHLHCSSYPGCIGCWKVCLTGAAMNAALCPGTLGIGSHKRGRGKDGAPIITFPEFAGFSEIPDDDFLNVVTYLTSIPSFMASSPPFTLILQKDVKISNKVTKHRELSLTLLDLQRVWPRISLEAASIGFIIIIDRRRDKWSAVKASLTRIAGAFPGNLQLVFVLRPSRFIQRAIADIGIKLYRDDFKMKIIMLNSVSDLHGYIDKSQLTRELGGTLEYGHSQWIHHRTAIENFAMTVKTTAQMLQTFGTDLAETELPNDVQCTEELLSSHTDHHSKLKDELKLAVKQGATLLTCIREPVTRSANSKLSPDELENVATVERLLAQLDETEKAFDQFWTKHHLKLEQCLQLRHFEHDFREVKLTLDNLMETQTSFADIGDSVTRVENLLKEQKHLEEKGQEPLEKAQSLALHGEQLIQNNHYAVDSIRPKCVELRRICDDFTNETKKKYDILGKSLELHKQLDKASQWCEAGIYLLASQAVDKCQSQEGAETALVEIEKFLLTAKEHQLSNPKEFYNQFDMILTPEIKANAQRIVQKLEDVQEMFDKRQVSLKKLAAKQTRPVQPVAPHPESSPKRASPKITRPAARNAGSSGDHTAQSPAPSSTNVSVHQIAHCVATGAEAKEVAENGVMREQLGKFSPIQSANGKLFTATNRRSTEISCPPKTVSEVELSKKKSIKKTKGGIKIEVMHEASQGGSSRVLVTSESDENLSTRRR